MCTGNQSVKADDLISRQAAIDARRYTFGNDEFSLEAAYHDCKLVFDGITDDDSFQEADTGCVLYYANEIIYALQEALKAQDVPDTNVGDMISRQAAIDAVRKNTFRLTFAEEQGCEGHVAWSAEAVYSDVIEGALLELPSAQPTLYGYNIEHLELIARVLQKEDLPPERVVEALTDIGRIVAIVEDEFEETLRKAVEQCTI